MGANTLAATGSSKQQQPAGARTIVAAVGVTRQRCAQLLCMCSDERSNNFARRTNGQVLHRRDSANMQLMAASGSIIQDERQRQQQQQQQRDSSNTKQERAKELHAQCRMSDFAVTLKATPCACESVKHSPSQKDGACKSFKHSSATNGNRAQEPRRNLVHSSC